MVKKTQRNTIEAYFEWFLNELLENGYIKWWKREPEKILASSAIEYGRYKRFKRKEKIIEQFNLFREVNYTHDYEMCWTQKAEYIFYEEITENRVFQFGKPLFIAHQKEIEEVMEICSIVDVKPTTSVTQRGGKVSSSVSFPFKQRLIWKNHNIYVNKVVPIPMAGTGYSSALFITAFTPVRYLLTDGGKMRRKIKFPTRMIKEYTAFKAEEIKTILSTTK